MTIAPDEQIRDLISDDIRRSFFLYAGAGSGKTASLINTLLTSREMLGNRFRETGSSIAVITYTNAASQEIKERLGFDTFGTIATIHSFAWQMVSGFTKDIATWLADDLGKRIAQLEEEERRGRAGTKASVERLRRIERDKARLEALPRVRRFVYSPDQTRPSRGGLNHVDVLGVFSHFLREKETFKSIFVGKYPIVLVDEAQDTNREVIAALLSLQRERPERFALGLFGDTMQRIYSDGDPLLQVSVPNSWARPAKTVNYRSSVRIVQLSNKIRSAVDHHVQEPAPGAGQGFVRLFAFPSDVGSRHAAEAGVREAMEDVTGDEGWRVESGVKTLILEHAMAAERYGFASFLGAFGNDASLRSSLMSGQALAGGPGMQLGRQVVPLVRALQAKNVRAADRTIRKYSPLLTSSPQPASQAGLRESGIAVREAVRHLVAVLDETPHPALRDVLDALKQTNLLALPAVLDDVMELYTTNLPNPDGDALSSEASAWLKAIDSPYEEFARYFEYINGESPFDTHQGVKGLEFERVMVVLDDQEAGGFGFSYNKLFAEADRGDSADLDDQIARTRRLFYVGCTRARSSLAVVLYTPDPAMSGQRAATAGWFSESEIVVHDGDAKSINVLSSDAGP